MRSSFISIIGAPNAGKSTLLNALLEQKLSIVTHKPQTTRNNIRGILTSGDVQLIFIDTPGLFIPTKELERKIVSNAQHALSEAEILCLVVDVKKDLDPAIQNIIEKYKQQQKKLILILNKIDTISETRLFKLITKLYNQDVIEEIFPVSALKNYGIEKLRDYFLSTAAEGQWYYEQEDITDRNYIFLTAEITREKLFLNLHEELPYALDVVTDEIKYENETAIIKQTIFVQRDSHKLIVIGKDGSRINALARIASNDMERLMVKKVSLSLFVKVRKDWVSRWNKK